MTRPDGRPALVTGATGLVGGAIALELLRRTEADVYCLARDTSREPAARRVPRLLTRAAADYGMDDVLDEIPARVRVLSGDITEPGCGVPDALLPAEIGEVWHAAASLKYRDRDRAEIELHNVTGTRHVAGLALRLGARALDLVSTAYVVGERTGLITEEPVTADRPANNVYEDSKRAAEALVSELPVDTVRILRPGIVIGHSETLAAPTTFGLYSFVDELTAFRTKVEAKLGNYLDHYAIGILGDPATRGNLVPVDTVATAAVRLSLVGAPGGIYHLTNTEASRLGEALAALTGALGIRSPRWVSDRAELNSIDAALSERLEFQAAYMLQDKVFDASRTRRHCGDGLLTVPLSPERIGEYITRYLKDGAAEQVVAARKAAPGV
ncbi:SDR family oxidoreductase [Streptomyces stramineus]|uniref:Thioester reductase (TE) domain-containing protein n=1 Tax=Streptomyces stramineus TaxID=173861 RepID=A0ABP3JUG5_9ACTN